MEHMDGSSKFYLDFPSGSGKVPNVNHGQVRLDSLGIRGLREAGASEEAGETEVRVVWPPPRGTEAGFTPLVVQSEVRDAGGKPRFSYASSSFESREPHAAVLDLFS